MTLAVVLGVIISPQSPKENQHGVVVLVSTQFSRIPGQFPALERSEEPGAQSSTGILQELQPMAYARLT